VAAAPRQELAFTRHLPRPAVGPLDPLHLPVHLAAQRGVQTLFTLAYDGPWIKFEQRDGFRPLALLLRRDLPAPTVTATSTAATRVNMNRLGLSLN